MLKRFNPVLPLTLLLVTLLTTACRPIQPLPTSNSPCSDADKISLLQQYAEAFKKQDAESGVALFLANGKLGGTAGPIADNPTGEYTTYPVEFKGQEEISGIIHWFIEGAGITNDILAPVVHGDTVTSHATVRSPWWLTHGIPAREADAILTMKVKDCKIAEMYWEFPAETLAAMPLSAKDLAAKCSADYKRDLFQDYINGMNEADNRLAAYPFADNAQLMFEAIPMLDAATQTYKSDPPSVIDGRAAFKPVIDSFISHEMVNTLDEKSITVNGSTLQVNTTISTPHLKDEPWFLPVTDINGAYTATFNDACLISDLKFKLEDGLAEKLLALKK